MAGLVLETSMCSTAAGFFVSFALYCNFQNAALLKLNPFFCDCHFTDNVAFRP